MLDGRWADIRSCDIMIYNTLYETIVTEALKTTHKAT